MRYTSINKVLIDKISGEWGVEPEDDCGVKIIRTTNFTNLGIIDFSKIVYRKIEAKKIEQKKLVSGDVIIEKSGGSPTQPVGRVVYFDNPDNSTYLCNNFTAILRANRANIFPKYLFYILFYNHMTKKTIRFQNKTTGIINLKLENYLKSEIPLPPLDDQIRIATILTRAEKLIAKRKESIRALDELLKSTFLEMFGDPVRNEKGWEKKSIDEIAEVRIGPFGSLLHAADYVENGVPLINPSHIIDGEIEPDYRLTITPEKFKELESYQLKINDVIVARRGEIGRCAIVRTAKPLFCGTGSMFIRIFSDYLPLLLQHQIYNTSLKEYLESKAKGVTMKNLNSTTLGNLQILDPPLPLQNQFAAIVEKVESLKAKYTHSLTDLENLYGSLSQRAFKGELDLSKVLVGK